MEGVDCCITCQILDAPLMVLGLGVEVAHRGAGKPHRENVGVRLDKAHLLVVIAPSGLPAEMLHLDKVAGVLPLQALRLAQILHGALGMVASEEGLGLQVCHLLCIDSIEHILSCLSVDVRAGTARC